MLKTIWRKIEMTLPWCVLFHFFFFLVFRPFNRPQVSLLQGGKKIKVMPDYLMPPLFSLKRRLWKQPGSWGRQNLGSHSAWPLTSSVYMDKLHLFPWLSFPICQVGMIWCHLVRWLWELSEHLAQEWLSKEAWGITGTIMDIFSLSECLLSWALL